jgi:hypothetical protein
VWILGAKLGMAASINDFSPLIPDIKQIIFLLTIGSVP